MRIRTADVGDAAALLAIYAPYVQGTAVSFEYEVPTIGEFSARIERTLERYPYLVVEEDGEVRGYAYAAPFHHRAAYNRSCEVSIYIDSGARRKGYGRALYDELQRRLAKMGILNLYACIAVPVEADEYLTRDSEEFHARLGFRKVGEFHKCGYKFGHWYNTVWMEKMIGEHV